MFKKLSDSRKTTKGVVDYYKAKLISSKAQEKSQREWP